MHLRVGPTHQIAEPVMKECICHQDQKKRDVQVQSKVILVVLFMFMELSMQNYYD